MKTATIAGACRRRRDHGFRDAARRSARNIRIQLEERATQTTTDPSRPSARNFVVPGCRVLEHADEERMIGRSAFHHSGPTVAADDGGRSDAKRQKGTP